MSEPESSSPGFLPPNLKGFEASLAALVPSSSTIDRDRLMYEAGRAARSSPILPWSIAAISAAACCGLLALTFVQASGRVQSSSSIASSPSSVPGEAVVVAAGPLDPASYAHFRRFLADVDLAALDASPTPTVAPDANDRRSLLHELLN